MMHSNSFEHCLDTSEHLDTSEPPENLSNIDEFLSMI